MLKFCCVSLRASVTCIPSMTRPRFDVEQRSVRRNTFGSELSSGARGVSGPKKMTVGCVIFTVPRRKRVSQAVTDETPSASTEIAMEAGSVISVDELQATQEQTSDLCSNLQSPQ